MNEFRARPVSRGFKDEEDIFKGAAHPGVSWPWSLGKLQKRQGVILGKKHTGQPQGSRGPGVRDGVIHGSVPSTFNGPHPASPVQSQRHSLPTPSHYLCAVGLRHGCYQL